MTKAGEKLYGDWNRANGIDPDTPGEPEPHRSRWRDAIAIAAISIATAVIIGGPIYGLVRR